MAHNIPNIIEARVLYVSNFWSNLLCWPIHIT